MTTHECPAAGCSEVVPFEVLACKAHWYALPPNLRKRISAAWRGGDLEAWAELRNTAVLILSPGPVR